MVNAILRDPLPAWMYLCAQGGIELDGRDEGLDQRLKQRLNPAAASLDEALAGATMEAFANAFFEAISPFVAMFRDILDFFETADATKGQDQWTISVGDLDVDLDHFRQWVAAWTEVAKLKQDVPAVDWHGVWEICRTLQGRAPVRDAVSESFGREVNSKLPQDVRRWVAAYNRGEYLPLPGSLLAPRFPEELRLCAAMAQAALTRIVELNLTRDRLMELYRLGRDQMDRSDGLDFWSIAQNETDYWLRTFVVGLSAAATFLSATELTALGSDLAKITNEFPLRSMYTDVVIDDLESVLSLPIWKKRYEFYSVWIATEIVRALNGHDVELHHEDGRMAFAFHETRVATIHSSPGPFTLVSERRSPLSNPRGEGRSAAVQPDLALWTSQDGREVCRLVAEVKHYKTSAKRKFVDVFEDYARALPQAEVYLVNYGPTGKAVYEVSDPVRRRCHAIERLTPSGREARQEFAKAVRECVGAPLKVWPKFVESAANAAVLVLDVSISMRSRLQEPNVEEFVRMTIEAIRPRELVAVDTSIVGSWAPDRAGFDALVQAGGGSTQLGDSVHKLLAKAPNVAVVTDQEGLDTIQGLNITEHDTQAYAPTGLLVRICSKPTGRGF